MLKQYMAEAEYMAAVFLKGFLFGMQMFGRAFKVCCSLGGRRHGQVWMYCCNPCRPFRGWGAAAL